MPFVGAQSFHRAEINLSRIDPGHWRFAGSISQISSER
jgi:hypothetical protein